MSLWDTFEVLFQRKVDLLTYKSINNPFLKQSIDSSIGEAVNQFEKLQPEATLENVRKIVGFRTMPH